MGTVSKKKKRNVSVVHLAHAAHSLPRSKSEFFFGVL